MFATAVAVAVVLLPHLLTTDADPDLWWHLHTGLRILDTGVIPQHDDLSYTAVGHPWVNHEWGTEVLFALAWRALGGAGLTLLRGALLAALIGALAAVWSARWRSAPGVALLALLGLPFLAVFVNVRAHSFTFALCALGLGIVELARRRPAALFAFVPLIALWVNLHGGFLLGLGLCGVATVSIALGAEHGPPRWNRRALWLALVVPAAVLATLLNPHGIELWGYLWGELGADHSTISEWQPITGLQTVFWAAFLVVPFLLTALARRWPPGTASVLLVLAFYVSWRHARFFPLVVMFGLTVAAPALDALWRSRIAGRLTLVERLGTPVAALGMAALLAVPFGIQTVTTLIRKGLALEVPRQLVPIDATAWLQGADTGPNLAAGLQWGGYLMWHLPDHKVAMDGRNLTIWDQDFVDAYLRGYDDGTLIEILAPWPTDAWLVAVDGALAERLQADPHWRRAYHDWQAAVFVPATAWSTDNAGPEQRSDAVATFP